MLIGYFRPALSTPLVKSSVACSFPRWPLNAFFFFSSLVFDSLFLFVPCLPLDSSHLSIPSATAICTSNSYWQLACSYSPYTLAFCSHHIERLLHNIESSLPYTLGEDIITVFGHSSPA